MAFPHSHKTVFVLDHGPYFAHSCHHVEFDMGRRVGPGCIPLAPISKSVWTVAVEAVAEYCRIVWDIFPGQDKLLRVVVASPECDEVQACGGWGPEGQTSASVMTSLALVGRPTADSRGGEHLAGGLAQGLEALCEPSPAQELLAEDGGPEGGLVNRGRLVLLTSLTDDRQLEQLVRDAESRLAAVNKRAAAAASLLPIAGCELVIVHTQPGEGTMRVRAPTDSPQAVSAILTSTLHTSPAGPQLASKLLYLCLQHYSLASTTVTGIPMKEEQNASSSANYDVELFHLGESHARLLGDVSDMTLARREGCEYNTATLKWCTPRGSAAAELQHCSGTYRITPTEVNSRQSSCLTNFLLSGRSVMLEMVKRSTNTKCNSHMLTSHGGEIFIHTLLSSTRSTLEDPPSISEGPGGRVTDYRIPDLAELMRAHRLAPWPGTEGCPGTRARARLERATRTFPATISATTVFNMPTVAPLLAILQGESITEEQLADCRKILYSLISMETKGDPLPGPLAAANPGKKGGRKDEQYRAMFSELERAVTAQAATSTRHHAVLECLMEVRNKPVPVKRESSEGEAGLAGRELDRYQAMTERERSDFNAVERQERQERTAEHLAGSPAPKKARLLGLGGASLLDIWRSRLEREAGRKHREFAGRRNLGEVVKLYTKLERDVKEEVVKGGDVD